MTAAPSWLRRNRWWLLALPVALALALGSSAYQVRTFWYEEGLHHRMATAAPGQYVTVTDDYSDAHGSASRRLQVRLSEVGSWPVYPIDFELRPPPPGLEVRFVQLDLRADPDQALSGCQILVEDADGRRYGLPDTDNPYAACVPGDTPGPSLPVSKDQERGALPEGQEPRPTAWTVRPRFLLPEGAEITKVLLWWEQPDYVELPAP